MMTRWLLLSEAKTVVNVGQAMQKLQQIAARIRDPQRRQWFLNASRGAVIAGEKRLDVPEEFTRAGEPPHGQFPYGEPSPYQSPAGEFYQGATPEAAALEFAAEKFGKNPRLDRWIGFRKGQPVQEIESWLADHGYTYDAEAIFNYLNDLFVSRQALPGVRPRRPEEYTAPAGWLKKPAAAGHHVMQSQEPAALSASAHTAALVKRGGETIPGAAMAEPPETTQALAAKSPSAFKFLAGDKGGYILWDNGAEAKITGVTSPTEVSISDLSVPASRAVITRTSKQRYPVNVSLEKGNTVRLAGEGYQFSDADQGAEIAWDSGISGELGDVKSPTEAALAGVLVPAGPFIVYGKGRKKMAPRLYGPSYEAAVRRLVANILMEVDYRSILRHRSKDPAFKSPLARGLEQTYEPYQEPKQFGDPTKVFEPSPGEELVTIKTRKTEAQPVWQGFENLADFLNSMDEMPSEWRNEANRLLAQGSTGTKEDEATAFEELMRKAAYWAKIRRSEPSALSKNIVPFTDLGQSGDLWMIGSADQKFLKWIASGGLRWCVQYSANFGGYLSETPEEYPYYLIILKKGGTPFRGGATEKDTSMVGDGSFVSAEREGQQTMALAPEGVEGYHPYILAHLVSHHPPESRGAGAPQVKNVNNIAIGPRMAQEIAPLFVAHPGMWQYMKGSEWASVVKNIKKLVGEQRWEAEAIAA
jgi:hypothetical protein